MLILLIIVNNDVIKNNTKTTETKTLNLYLETKRKTILQTSIFLLLAYYSRCKFNNVWTIV